MMVPTKPPSGPPSSSMKAMKGVIGAAKVEGQTKESFVSCRYHKAKATAKAAGKNIKDQSAAGKAAYKKAVKEWNNKISA